MNFSILFHLYKKFVDHRRPIHHSNHSDHFQDSHHFHHIHFHHIRYIRHRYNCNRHMFCFLHCESKTLSKVYNSKMLLQ
jgi:hypothetical protein